MKKLLSRLRERWIVSLVGVLALVAAVAVGVGAWVTGGSGGLDGTGDFDRREVVNRAGGYRLTVPEDWQTTVKNTGVQAVAPDKKAIVTVGIGRPGPLPDTAALFFQKVGRNYTAVQWLGVEGRRIGGAQALVHAGIGTNDQGGRVRFLAITIENQPANYAIAVRTAAGSDPEKILPRVNAVVGTFEPLRS